MIYSSTYANGFNNQYDAVKETYASRTLLLYFMKLFQPLGILRLIISYPNDYPNKYQSSQAWTQYLDTMWDSQWLTMAYQTNNFDKMYKKEQILMKGYILGNIPLLSIPAGMNATCEQFGYKGSECNDYEIRNIQWIKMHQNQVNISKNGSIIVCEYPCDHAFAWEKAEWVVNHTIGFLSQL